MPGSLTLKLDCDIIAEAVTEPPSCCVCLSELTSGLVALESCPCIVCQACLTRYLTDRINSCLVDSIECPSCAEQLCHTFILHHLPPAQCKRYERALETTKLNRQVQENTALCWCPAPDCNTIVNVHEHKIQSSTPTKKQHVETAVSCPSCSHDFCFTCKLPAHSGKSCEKAMTIRTKSLHSLHELEFRKWAKTMTKRCPEKTCGVIIERNRERADCNHMVCSACRTEFCWLCRSKIAPLGHFDDDSVFGCPGLQYGGPDVPRKTRLKERMKAIKKRGFGRNAAIAVLSLAVLPVALPFHSYQLYKALK